MSVYKYIAELNPDAAYEICKKYGFFKISDTSELAQQLESIVARGGEDSLKDVMSVHPDREVILEIFEKKSDLDKPNTKQDCGCKNSSFQHRRRFFAGADGKTTTTTQTNTYILIGALMVSLAIISSIKKS